MDEQIQGAWLNVLADPLGQGWPGSLLGALNNNPEDLPADQQRSVEELRQAGYPISAPPPPNVAALREQQKELRALVDQFLHGADEQEIRQALNERLASLSFRAFVADPKFYPGHPSWKGAKSILRFRQKGLEQGVTYADWLGFARLLDSPLRDRLRKCPVCSTYFLAARWSGQQFCSPRCGWRNRDVTRRQRDPEAYNARKAADMRQMRARKRQPAPKREVARA